MLQMLQHIMHFDIVLKQLFTILNWLYTIVYQLYTIINKVYVILKQFYIYYSWRLWPENRLRRTLAFVGLSSSLVHSKLTLNLWSERYRMLHIM